MIDPELVPSVRLASGAEVPAVGLGTFGSDHVSHDQVAAAVERAVHLGYRHLDCASVYGNEDRIGAALGRLTANGISRDDLWISSKVWNDAHHDVASSCERTLQDLGLDHLDVYLVHWPFPNHHPPHADVGSRSADARPHEPARFRDTWAQMESLVQRGLVRHIGTSNMTIPKLEALLATVEIAPAVNQMELHPHFQQPELVAYLDAHGIRPIGFCPLGSPARPERDTTPDDTAPLADPVIGAIASTHGVHPAAICLRWAVQRGQIPLPFSTDPAHQLDNLRAVTELRLSDEEMGRLADVDRSCRLIKGQVFCWRDDQPWQELWDPDGVIAT
ncbi:MAG: aldo/keto reductase [Actinomycetota bacterium]